MKKFLAVIGIIGGAALIIQHFTKNKVTSKLSIEEKRQYLIAMDKNAENSPFKKMSNDEIETVYNYYTNYRDGDRQKKPLDPVLKQKLIIIGNKYNIFT